MKPLIQSLLSDFAAFCVLVTVSMGVGLIPNQLRDFPLPLIYTSKAQRLDSEANKLANSMGSVSKRPAVESTPTVIDLNEIKKIVESRQQIILDARPEIFHRLGHVPGALSLARDDFENAYEKLRSRLEIDKNQPIVLYCSSASCEDSRLVQTALSKLGYTNVAVFSGGWDAWTGAKLPEEINP